MDGATGTWSTTDLGTAAYCHMRGLRVLKVELGAAAGAAKFVFMFVDPDDEGPNLSVQYINSESRQFDAAVRSLKKLTYDEPNRRRRDRARARG